MKGYKQGKWAVHIDPLRGEPGFEDEGRYTNDRKEGVWRRFNLMGDIMAIETYRWGNKNGRCQYFTIIGLEHEESWRALNPNKLYDTIDVVDVVNPNKYEQVVVKVETSSLKHGTWKYYNPSYGTLIRTENYVLDKLQTIDEASNKLATNTIDSLNTKPIKDSTKIIPKQVLDFEKKNKGKKLSKLRDGRTGG
jgi:antitoxin component YwqK of YwqJK toxin-antitoxin module